MRPTVMRLGVPSLIVSRVGALEYRLLVMIPPMPTPTTTITTVAGAPIFSMVVWIRVMVVMMMVVVGMMRPSGELCGVCVYRLGHGWWWFHADYIFRLRAGPWVVVLLKVIVSLGGLHDAIGTRYRYTVRSRLLIERGWSCTVGCNGWQRSTRCGAVAIEQHNMVVHCFYSSHRRVLWPWWWGDKSWSNIACL